MAAPSIDQGDSVSTATDKAEEFLKPLFDGPQKKSSDKRGNLESSPRTQASLAERIVLAKQEHGESSVVVDDKEVIAIACRLLIKLHEVVCLEQGDKPQGQASYSTALFSSAYGLLDLIILEGVYPSLSPGIVSIPERRVKSILFTKTSLHIPFPKDLGMLESIVYDTLDYLAIASHRGIQPLIRGRVLNDLIAAHADLAFSPNRAERKRREALTKLQSILDQLSLSTVYQVLSGLLRPQVPDWFRIGLSELLALLPTKPLGVRNAIEFIAASNNENQSSDIPDSRMPSQGPPLPFDALKQASKLLSAVPRSMKAEVYMDKVTPQLMSLLDGDAGAELSQVSAFVIGNGFLGKRSLGAPGSIGWQYLVEPMLSVISPDDNAASTPYQDKTVGKAHVISLDVVLSQMLRRMSALVRACSSTALTGRLLRPLIKSLWGIAAFDASSVVDPTPVSLARSLLQAFFTLTGGPRELAMIAQDLLWDGPKAWKFTIGDGGGIAIVVRQSSKPPESDLLTLLHKVDQRVEILCNLIASSSIDDASLGTFFFEKMKHWLSHSHLIDEHLVEAKLARNPQQDISTTKLVLALLDRFGTRIAAHPENALRLISQVFQQRLRSAVDVSGRKRPNNSKVFNSLAFVEADEHLQETHESVMDDDEAFNIALSLLNAILIQPSFNCNENNNHTLGVIEDYLRALDGQKEPIRQAVSQGLQTISEVRSSATDDVQAIQLEPKPKPSQKAFQKVQQDLSSALPPVRTSAIHSLETQIRETSLPLDVPASAVMLIHVIRTDPEDYVYLAAIRALTLLANERDARLATRLLVDAFQDSKEEAGIDGRLRLGEAVIGIVESMGASKNSSLLRQIVEIISDAVIKVASRRGERRREQEERKRQSRLDRMKKKEAERAWGGDVPEDPMLNLEQEEDNLETPEQKTRRLRELGAMESIVKGWENTGPEEDTRVRVTALSILSEVLEHATDFSSQQRVEDTTEVALSILIMETSASQIVLRRAAVLTLFALLKGIDRAFEENRQLSIGVEVTRWLDIERVLSLLRDVDPDDLVRGHASAVLEGLEAFRMKQILGVKGDGMMDALTPRFTLEGRLRGLDVDVGLNSGGDERGRVKIEEIE